MAKPSFTPHELTRLAYDTLRTLPRGASMSYGELRKRLKVDPQVEGYVYVKAARDMLVRDKVGVFWAIEGDGIKHLTDQEAASITTATRRKRIRGQAKRFRREADTVNISLLTRDQQASLTGALANAGAIMHLTDFRFAEAQRSAISKQMPPPPLPPEIPQ